MTPRDCPRFDSCDAPLCPLDEDRAKRTWFPDEPICDRAGMGTTRFVKIQRRIAKAVVLTDTFFTVPMLEAVDRIRPETTGLDPDSNANRQHRELEWIKKHRRGPGRVWTPEARALQAERARGLASFQKHPRSNVSGAPEPEIRTFQSTPSPTP